MHGWKFFQKKKTFYYSHEGLLFNFHAYIIIFSQAYIMDVLLLILSFSCVLGWFSYFYDRCRIIHCAKFSFTFGYILHCITAIVFAIIKTSLTWLQRGTRSCAQLYTSPNRIYHWTPLIFFHPLPKFMGDQILGE